MSVERSKVVGISPVLVVYPLMRTAGLEFALAQLEHNRGDAQIDDLVFWPGGISATATMHGS